MGYSDAGCYGGEIETPHIDRLAAEGLRFTQIYSTGRCWPSRTCILTGYYAQQVRMDPPQGLLPAWARVIPHYLKPLGYRCYHSGKWHLNGAPKAVADGGFDRSYKLDDHDRHFGAKAHSEDDRPLPPVKPGEHYYSTTAIADFGIRCLKEHQAGHADKPFLLYLAFIVPHFPLHAYEEDIARYRQRYLAGWDAIRDRRYQRMREMGLVSCALSPRDPETVPGWNLSEEQLRKQIGSGEAGHAVAWTELSDEQKQFQATKMAIHAAMIDRMDREVGRVLEQLRTMNAMDNTVIVFASDNGASAEQIIRGDRHDPSLAPGSAGTYLCLGPGWSTASNTPFRLHKSWVHEGGISSPFVVHWPAGIADRGQLRQTPGHFIDVLPTLLDLAHASPPGDWNGLAPPPLPGKSLVPAFARDVPVARDYLYWHHLQNRALRIGDMKLVSRDAKDDDSWELYDLTADRAESKDLAPQKPEVVRSMSSHWHQCEDEFRREAGPAAPK
jgi:arylsulfatase A-like enzyme